MQAGCAEKAIRQLLETAGIEVNGSRPFDIQVHNAKFYSRLVKKTSLGLGESYMDGWWDCEQIDEFISKALRADLQKKVSGDWKMALHLLRAKIFNLQKLSRAYKVGEYHYDIGNELYEAMLDKRMNYTCAYWKNATNLDEAQAAKLELVCRKTGLQPGMTVLDIGCGFGAFAAYAAEKYGVKVTGVTVSKKQVEWARAHYADLPIDIRLQDYRRVTGQFDRVISIGVMEHVGYKNYRTYMEVVRRTLKTDGLAFFHTIGGNVSTSTIDPWTTKYIFPNGMLPSMAQLCKAMEGLFIVEDWHNLGPDYDPTLMAWNANFEAAWPELKKNYNERFYRMWRYYLLSSAGGFRARNDQLWQVVMNIPGRPQPECRKS